MKHLRKAIAAFVPTCEQEERDQKMMLAFLDAYPDCLTRDNNVAHMTASAWVVNPARDKVLMVYHNIYDSWSWTGGHADGDADLAAVAYREACEETGIKALKPLMDGPASLEVITVDGHVKKGKYVSSHLHMNLTYLFEASEEQALTVKEDENSGVAWIPRDELENYVSEPWMLKWIYQKL